MPESCIVQTAPEPRSMTWKGTNSGEGRPGRVCPKNEGQSVQQGEGGAWNCILAPHQRGKQDPVDSFGEHSPRRPLRIRC